MNWTNILNALLQTFHMVIVSTLISYALGLPLGILLNVTSKKGLRPCPWINLIIGTIVNILRSIPCLLLIIILIPVTNFFFGKGSWSGNWYSMVIPLVFTSFAFIARMVEQSLSEVSVGKVEAIKSLGATDLQIVFKVLIPEARSSLISGFAVSVISIIGYTSFAGYIAAGGLIVEAFNLGYYGTQTTGMWVCIILVILIVQIIQEGGLLIAKKLDRRRNLS